ncbi:hypothetical protein [Streptomyces sp. WAC05950]|uniref:hypothetical protein n=1 Tax=Streptomyces sp. WAC05950 TaxID=2487419 RepID=UPI000F745C13|nr:hypothetical protein [Streptomyces sp. WAC05950]RST13475.1 hypothetical protein EF904_07275 [Streptomyces sp. WAC05950]
MSSAWPIRRPTENAALRAVGRRPRPLPEIPALMAALIVENRASDRHGANLAAHRVVRVAEGVTE